MAEVLGPVETLRAAAAKLREEPSDPWWWDGVVHPDVAGPLANWLDAEAYRVDRLLHGLPPAPKCLLDELHGEALVAARVLLGVPNV